MTCTCLHNHTATGPRSIHQADARCPQHGEKRMTTAEVFANYLGLTPANALWAFEKWRYCTECGMPEVLDEPDPYCPSEHCYHRLTATSPLAPEPTPGWLEALVRGGFDLTNYGSHFEGSARECGVLYEVNAPHPTHAMAHALIAADPALRSACERAADYNEKETNNA